MTPYRSTVHFTQFVGRVLARPPESILYVAAGAGPDLAYFKKQFPNTKVAAMESNSESLSAARAHLAEEGIDAAILMERDWLSEQPEMERRFEGLLSLSTLSQHKSPVRAITRMCQLADSWVAASVMAWNGDHDFMIDVRSLDDAPDNVEGSRHAAYYNIYSLKTLSRLFERNGFIHFKAEQFQMDVDLPPPAELRLGTYTCQTAAGNRLQISGPLFMPWWFIFAERSAK
ncbi:MAG: hypothetical protein V4568_05215 [Pseudomonadota bacterium]